MGSEFCGLYRDDEGFPASILAAASRNALVTASASAVWATHRIGERINGSLWSVIIQL
jgi:hypothetical protein